MSECICIRESGQIVWDRDCPERLQNQVRLLEQNSAALKGGWTCDDCDDLTHEGRAPHD